MNFNDLTEEQFNRMAEELCRAWTTLEWLRGRTTNAELGTINHRKLIISEVLGQDPDKEPKWPPVRKWQVGLTQYRTVEYSATVEVEASDADEAKKKALEAARKDERQWTSHIHWQKERESFDHERELAEDVWCCDEIND